MIFFFCYQIPVDSSIIIFSPPILSNLASLFRPLKNVDPTTVNKVCLVLFNQMRAQAIKVVNLWFQSAAVVTYVVDKGID